MNTMLKFLGVMLCVGWCWSCQHEVSEPSKPSVWLASANQTLYSLSFDSVQSEVVLCDSLHLGQQPLWLQFSARGSRLYVGLQHGRTGGVASVQIDSVSGGFHQWVTQAFSPQLPRAITINERMGVVASSDGVHWGIFPVEEDGDLIPQLVTFPTKVETHRYLNALTLSPDGQWIYQCTKRPLIYGIGQAAGRDSVIFPASKIPLQLHFNASGYRAYALLSSGELAQLKYDGFGHLQLLQQDSFAPYPFNQHVKWAFSPDERYLAVVCGDEKGCVLVGELCDNGCYQCVDSLLVGKQLSDIVWDASGKWIWGAAAQHAQLFRMTLDVASRKWSIQSLALPIGAAPTALAVRPKMTTK